MRFIKLRHALFAGLLGVVSASASAAEDVDALLARCAPNVHPETMRAVVSAESRGNVLAVADAGPLALPWSQRKHLVRSHYPSSTGEAVALVENLLAKGHTVSLGLSQINDRNLARLGLSVAAVFEPCANIAAGAAILSEFYTAASKKYGAGSRALRAALSGYNSGSFVRGEADGYVDIVYRQAGRPLVLRQGKAGAAGGVTVPALGSDGFSRVAIKGAAPVVRRVGKRAREDFTMIVTAFDQNH